MATKKETKKQKSVRIAKELKIQLSMELDVSLGAGWIIDKFWFNEKSSYKFCTLMNTAINLGLNDIVWLKKDGTSKVITITEAKQMAGQMMLNIKTLHGIVDNKE
jgi:hypothetical protein